MATSMFSSLQSGLMDLIDPKPEPVEEEAAPVEEPKAAEPESAPKEEEVSPEAEPKIFDTAKPTNAVNALECDYESNCSALYKKIENAIEDVEWEPIAKFLDTGYWPGSLFADEKSPKEQTMTWVTKFDKEDPTKVRWSQLPLHLAIVCGAPFSIVGRLIEHYPQGVRCTDDQRNLPIHLALRHNASDDVVAYLLMQFPESCNARGKDRRTPVQCALRAESKVRGKMLEIFITKTKAKTRMELSQAVESSEASIADKESQITNLEAELEAKTMALAEMEGKLAALKTGDNLDEMKKAKLAQVHELEKKIESLEAKTKAAEEAEVKSREQEATLIKEIESVTKAIDEASSPAELESVKKEVETIKSAHLENSKETLVELIKALSTDLESSAKDLTEEEKKEMTVSVEKLIASVEGATSSDDILALRAETDEFRATLKERESVASSKRELDAIKAAMEAELKVEGKSAEETAILEKALASLEGLEGKTNDELEVLKKELGESTKAIDEIKEEITSKVEPAPEEKSMRSARSARSAQSGSTRKRKAKNRIKSFIGKIMGGKKADSEIPEAAADEEDLILPPCLSGDIAQGPSTSFEDPKKVDADAAPVEAPVVPPSTASVASKKSVKSFKSMKSNKSSKSKKSVGSKKSMTSAASKKSAIKA